MGANLMFHKRHGTLIKCGAVTTTRFDVHPVRGHTQDLCVCVCVCGHVAPYRLFPHPDIPGGLGIVVPGTAIHLGALMLAARADEVVSIDTSGVVPNAASTMMRHVSTRSSTASSLSGTSNAAGTLMQPTGLHADGSILRTARAEIPVGAWSGMLRSVIDTGVVHRVVITTNAEGYILTSSGIHNLYNGAPVRMAFLQKRFTSNSDPPCSLTVRVTCVSLRHVRVGDEKASF